eukprot:GHVQ01014199.1.p1 GENE.GHVQ01014199.1~~GHVQ01014199.1.p1  ORF type:complete len:403 (-),score=21.73 GHVQ01014199.1:1220-2428(-)
MMALCHYKISPILFLRTSCVSTLMCCATRGAQPRLMFLGRGNVSSKQMCKYSSAKFCSLSTSSAPRILLSSVNNIVFNMAIEQYFLSSTIEVPILFLWRNNKTVVVGRHQNPWSECDIQTMNSEGVFLARRHTGGGAVYQDLGNTNFSFFYPGNKIPKDSNNSIILTCLKNSFGIEGAVAGRNDLTVNDLKFSGSAYRQSSKGCLHHGTILLDVGMNGLSKCLTPHYKKLQSKGVSSVSSRVVNLRQLNGTISHEGVCSAMIQQFQNHFCPAGVTPVVETVNETSELAQSGEFRRQFDHLSEWEWRFGRTPKFQNVLETRFDWGLCTVHLDINHGRIEALSIFSDCLSTELIDDLHAVLRGSCFTEKGIRSAIDFLPDKGNYDRKLLEDFRDWMSSAIYETA